MTASKSRRIIHDPLLCTSILMEIPWDSIDDATLNRLLGEIVTRDGTDYGDEEKSLAQKVEEVKAALSSGSALLHWDSDSESASIISK